MGQSAPDELRFAYDQENDVAYVSLGEPKEAVCETFENGVVIKRDLHTRKIIGLILLDFSHTFGSTHPRPAAPGLKAELVVA
jgi:uncharacterized protein YuzE